MLSVNNSALKVKIILKNHVRTGFFLISMKKFVLNKISCYAKYDKLKILPPGIGFAFFMQTTKLILLDSLLQEFFHMKNGCPAPGGPVVNWSAEGNRARTGLVIGGMAD